MKYQIECGLISQNLIEAKNHEIAFRRIVKNSPNLSKNLGFLMRFREVDEFGKPAKSAYFTRLNKDSGKWKYQDPLAILNN